MVRSRPRSRAKWLMSGAEVGSARRHASSPVQCRRWRGERCCRRIARHWEVRTACHGLSRAAVGPPAALSSRWTAAIFTFGSWLRSLSLLADTSHTSQVALDLQYPERTCAVR
eukprot:scaffold10862_cov63-Phaeocystis_antarctica.AAC.2